MLDAVSFTMSRSIISQQSASDDTTFQETVSVAYGGRQSRHVSQISIISELGASMVITSQLEQLSRS